VPFKQTGRSAAAKEEEELSFASCFHSSAPGGTVSLVFNMAEDNIVEESTEPTEGNESPDDREEEHGDMDDDGKIFINYSALRNRFGYINDLWHN
jgi:hypothetical protein